MRLLYFERTHHFLDDEVDIFGGYVADPIIIEMMGIRLPLGCVKIAFYTNYPCRIVKSAIKFTMSTTYYAQYDDILEPGLTVTCMCTDIYNDKDEIFFMSMDSNYDLKIMVNDELPEILCIFASAKKEPPRLADLCSQICSFSFKNEYEWRYDSLFKETMSGKIAKDSISKISITNVQKLLLFFNIYGKNALACRFSIVWPGHLSMLSPKWIADGSRIDEIYFLREWFSRETDLKFEKYSLEWYILEEKRRLRKYLPRKKWKCVYYAYSI
ncbi:MAG: hypothetical protein RR313_04310 [Anaerovoracaceae bacterium]